MVDLVLACRVAVEAAEAAGALLLRGIDGDTAISAKGFKGDVVTSLDRTAESQIVQRIRDVFPEHRIFAEERGLLDGPDTNHLWLVDPLDGTQNLLIGLHMYMVG